MRIDDERSDGKLCDIPECDRTASEACDQCGRDTCWSHYSKEADICVDCKLIWEMGRAEDDPSNPRGVGPNV